VHHSVSNVPFRFPPYPCILLSLTPCVSRLFPLSPVASPLSSHLPISPSALCSSLFFCPYPRITFATPPFNFLFSFIYSLPFPSSLLPSFHERGEAHRLNFVYDDGNLSPPLLKVVVTVTTTFSKWNLQFLSNFLLPEASEAFCGLKYAENAIAAGTPPRTQLRELTTLPQTL